MSAPIELPQITRLVHPGDVITLQPETDPHPATVDVITETRLFVHTTTVSLWIPRRIYRLWWHPTVTVK